MKIIYQGKTKKGKDVLIRYPQVGDEVEMLSYINQLSQERTFIRYQGEQESLENEIKYLNSILGNLKNNKAVHLLVFSQERLIAASDVHMLDKTEKHLGIFGIAVSKDFRGEGVGKLLMKLVLKEAEKEIADLKIITLDVYQTNLIAQNLYKEFGFVEYGTLPNGVARNNTFEDRVLMYKNVK